MTVQSVITTDEFENVIKSHIRVCIDFYATWCGPCRKISPYIESISEDKKYTNVHFIKVDIEMLEDIAESFNITSMPTFVFVVNEKEVSRFVGADKSLLHKHLDALE